MEVLVWRIERWSTVAAPLAGGGLAEAMHRVLPVCLEVQDYSHYF